MELPNASDANASVYGATDTPDAVEPKKQTEDQANAGGGEAPTDAKAKAGSLNNLKPDSQAEQRAAEKRKFKLKVDGKEEDWEGTDADLVRDLQLSRASRKKMQEAADQRKAVGEFYELLKTDPIGALKDPAIGVDIEEMVRQRLIQRFEEEELKKENPHEYEKRELQRKLEESESRHKDAEERQKQEARQKLTEATKEQMEKSFIAALEKANLPKTRQTLMEMVNIARAGFAKGLDLTPEELAAEAEERLSSNAKHFIGALKGEELVKRLGDDVVKEVVRHVLAKHKGKSAAPTAQAAEPQSEPVLSDVYEPEVPKKQTRVSPSEFRRRLYGGK